MLKTEKRLFYLLAGTALAAGGLLSTAVLAQEAPVTPERLVNAASEPQNWLTVHQQYNSNRYSTLDAVNRDTVKDLHLAFAFPIAQPVGSVSPDNEATPLVDSGMMYLSDGWGVVYKVDVTNGRRGMIVWKYDPAVEKEGEDRSRNRGVALLGNSVVNNTVDGRVFALSRDTGEMLWENQLGRQNEFDVGEKFTTAPLAVEDKILVGQSAGDWGTRGWLAAVNAETGEQVWRTYTIPAPGEPGSETWKDDHNAWKTGGGSLWTTGSYDPDQRVTIWGTANPVPMFDPEFRPGDNLFTNSAIAFNIDDGSMKWYFQYTPNESWDYDEIGVHLLYDVEVNGEMRKVVGHFGRNGFYYQLDRTDGQFLSAAQYVEKLDWTAGIDPKTGKPVEYDPSLDLQTYIPEHRATRARQASACPTILGGLRWQPPAYNPVKMIAYGAGTEGCSQITVQALDPLPDGGNPAGPGKTFQGGTTVNDSLGGIHAVDVRSGAIKAKVDLPHDNLSGMLATAGGLVFTGQQDGNVVAYDDETLQELWSVNVGAKFKAPPMTYSVDGKQYIAIMSGGPNGGPGDLANAYSANIVWVFSL